MMNRRTTTLLLASTIASLALGATQSQTLLRVVLPGALPGILTGAVLAVSGSWSDLGPATATLTAYAVPRG